MHVPVLLEEVIRYLDPRENEEAIDATINGGGHARAILEKTGPDGKLLGLDRDSSLIERAKENLAKFEGRVIVRRGNFANIATIAKSARVLHPRVILFDLGVSSYHLASERGFSFMAPASPLDMRYDPTENTPTAEVILNTAPSEELSEIFARFGEEPRASRIARLIVEERKRRKFHVVGDLLKVMEGISGRGRIHPATRIFQALRIAVNNELSHMELGIREAFRILDPGGRLAVISFHSLEDRIVKLFFRELKPVAAILTPKPITATAKERMGNPRSRSAKLRVVQKLV